MMWFKFSPLVLILLLPKVASAETWEVIAEESKIAFTASQSGSPTGGAFPVYDSEIIFDCDDLASSTVWIEIDLASVETAYADVAKNLVQEPWFNVPAFPNAVFEASTFVASNDGVYEAQGTLMVRDMTQPVVLSFMFEEYGAHPEKDGWLKAVMVGEVTLRRTAFGVGQGDWEATDVVADDVAVTIRLAAEAPANP